MCVCIFPKTSTVLSFYVVFQMVMSFSYSSLFSPLYSSLTSLSLFNLPILVFPVSHYNTMLYFLFFWRSPAFC